CDLALENAELRQRLAVAEALASERNRIIDVQQQMLKMLEAKQAAPATAAPVASPPATPTQANVQEPRGTLGRIRRRFSARS
ncbi:hypothetical protein, partial [Rhodococcus marinonascens]|uniref:hypothetical protein n=1 Tax=Rhodococcus marinonascens TaxID=38311 RepID=UPI000B0437B2